MDTGLQQNGRQAAGTARRVGGGNTMTGGAPAFRVAPTRGWLLKVGAVLFGWPLFLAMIRGNFRDTFALGLAIVLLWLGGELIARGSREAFENEGRPLTRSPTPRKLLGALAAGAAAVVAGTRFLLTHESPAHPVYQRRIMQSDKTIRTNLFGLSWPAPHRVVPNAATDRWCRPDGSARALPAALNAVSAKLSRFARDDGDTAAILRMQRPAMPFFSPAAPTAGMPDHWVERSALHAGSSARRIPEVVSAAEAVALLTPA